MAIDMRAHQISAATFGKVIGLNGLVIVLLQPWLSLRLQRYRPHLVLLAGASLVGLGFGAAAWATAAWHYGLVVVTFTIGEIAFLPLGYAFVARIAPRELVATYQALPQAAWGLAAICGPVLGSLVMESYGAGALWLGSFVFITAAVLAYGWASFQQGLLYRAPVLNQASES